MASRLTNRSTRIRVLNPQFHPHCPPRIYPDLSTKFIDNPNQTWLRYRQFPNNPDRGKSAIVSPSCILRAQGLQTEQSRSCHERNLVRRRVKPTYPGTSYEKKYQSTNPTRRELC